MPKVTVTKDRYVIDNPLYQWDLNEVLEIRGLSLPSIPEIHFTNNAMDRAIVRQASMDGAGVITVGIPNSLLQKPSPVIAYVCVYEGDTFTSQYKIEIPLKLRKQPMDYSFSDDQEEIYSFNALENKINNLEVFYDEKYTDVAGRVSNLETVVDNHGDTLANKANAPVIVKTDLFASGWVGTEYSFEADYPFNQYDLEIAPDNTATPEELSAFNGAKIVGSAETNIVKAYGNVPGVDIPIVLKAVRK